jgi:hypothetical protein
MKNRSERIAGDGRMICDRRNEAVEHFKWQIADFKYFKSQIEEVQRTKANQDATGKSRCRTNSDDWRLKVEGWKQTTKG